MGTNFSAILIGILSCSFQKMHLKMSSARMAAILSRGRWVDTLRPRQNGRHLPDDIFKCIFLNENVWISLKISLKFVPRVPINNIPALVLIMAWRRLDNKPLSEPMMVNLPTHICVTRPQWVKCRYSVTQKMLIRRYFLECSTHCYQCNHQILRSVFIQSFTCYFEETQFCIHLNHSLSLLRNIRTSPFHIASIDVLVTQGAKASLAMISI